MIKTVILVGIGGGIGSISRYLCGLIVTKYFQTFFPVATFCINVLGCLLIGLLLGYFEKQHISSSNLKILFVTGFCGGYTTFSTFASENINLLQSGQALTALMYIMSSILFGLIAVWIGTIIADSVF